MHDRPILGLAAALLLTAGCGGAPKTGVDDPATKCDVTTDDGARAAYKAATGEELSTDPGRSCLARSETFPGMVAIGSFADDRGCIWQGALHGCTWNDPTAARAAMLTAGWARADAAERQRLAVAWLDEVEQLTTQDVEATVDGDTLVVSYWVPEEVGMQPPGPDGPYRIHYRVVFAADGSHGQASMPKD